MSNAQNEIIDEMIQEAEVEPSTSPVPEEVVGDKLMTFPEAIAEATIGKRIRRIVWPENEFGFFENDLFLIHRDKDGVVADYQWIISKGDAIEKDYVTL